MNQKRGTKRIKGQGNLFREARSPYWQMRYWNGWTEVRESARTADRKEALDMLQQRLLEVSRRRGEGAGPERIKIDALLTLLIEDYRRHDKADLYQAELRIEKHLRPQFGDLIARKITSKHIREYMEKRKRMRQTPRSTANWLSSVALTILERSKIRRLCTVSPESRN